MTTTSTIEIAALDGKRDQPTSEQLVELRAGDEGWDDAVLVWNATVRERSVRQRPPFSRLRTSAPERSSAPRGSTGGSQKTSARAGARVMGTLPRSESN